MARTNLPAYTSVYRDPGSVAVNTELRKRYAAAFKQEDALTGAVDSMVSAQFEGDQNLLDDLSTTFNNKLRDRARRGDYETLGMAISRDSRDFVREYSPIKKNYETVAAYQTKLNEAYEKGDIDAETYKRSMALSSYDYKGLQKNEDGTIDESSYFSGYNFVKDQNISKLMDDAMTGYAAHKGGSDIQRVGQGPNAMYKMRVGNKYEIVPQGDVERIFNDVISSPEVKAYLRQKADLRSFDITDEELQRRLSVNLYGDPNNPDSKGLHSLVQELLNEGKTKEAEAYQAIIDQQEKLLHGTGIESTEELINMRRASFKQGLVDEEVGRERNAALTKYVRHNKWVTSIQEYDELYLDGYKRALDNYQADYYEDTPLTEIQYEGGNTQKSITAHIKLQEDMRADQITKFNLLLKDNGYEGDVITEEQIMSGNFDKITIGDQPITDYIDVKMLNTIQDKIRSHKSIQHRGEQILKEAYEKFGKKSEVSYEEWLKNTEKLGMGTGNQRISYQDLLTSMEAVLGMDSIYSEGESGHRGQYGGKINWENAQVAFARLVDLSSTKYNNKNFKDLGNGRFSMTGKDINGNIKDDIIIDMNNIDQEGLLNIIDVLYSTQNNKNNNIRKLSHDIWNRFQRYMDDNLGKNVWSMAWGNAPITELRNNMFKSAKKELINFDAEVDKYLEDNSTMMVGGQASKNMPGMNSDESQKNTKIINDALVNKTLPEHFLIYYDGQKQEGTGNVNSLIEDMGWDESELKVTDVKFHTTPFMGEPTLQLRVQGRKDEENVSTTVILPYSNLKNTGLEEYFNSPNYRAELEVNAARQSAATQTTIVFSKTGEEDGPKLVWDFNKDGAHNSEIVTIISADGGTIQVAPDDPLISAIINDAVKQGYNFWTQNPNYGGELQASEE